MKKHGFTLIEILVVIAIIASLVAMAIPNYLSARQRAQDAKTKSEMGELKNALRLYYNDYNRYPPSSGTPGGLGMLKGCGTNEITACPCTAGGSDFATGNACANLYMKQIPTAVGSGILYYQTVNGDDFCLEAVLNNKSDADSTTSQNRCASSCGIYCPIVAGSGRYCVCAD